MSLRDRLRRRPKPSGTLDQAPSKDDLAHLRQFAQTRKSVEAYVEPRTNVTPMSVLLVAADGEWTRRRTTEKTARKLADQLKIPVYDVQRTGYPQRMRDWSARNKKD
ncbi:oxidoreductase [Blastococcus sp. Marseille-P5729]|uniref:oxidoreductase n=1 Tax=Blastococcus sp. Marseille-P5729 TaxID=2086582 RepID=UPI0018FE3C0E|nr:oxidoreductase [Blastococcus sp. Marseille-P5729]